MARLSPILFEVSRLLAVVPALCGVLWCAWHFFLEPNSSNAVYKGDYVVAALWALLTAHQSLQMTTGLLTRWSIYYPPLSTLIRLLALQLAICWPATHFTLSVLNADKRPAAVWAVVGTTTCVSRAVQIWVTSNLWWDEGEVGDEGVVGSALVAPPSGTTGHAPPKGYHKRQSSSSTSSHFLEP